MLHAKDRNAPGKDNRRNQPMVKNLPGLGVLNLIWPHSAKGSWPW
jgi:hypothetical protein